MDRPLTTLSPRLPPAPTAAPPSRICILASPHDAACSSLLENLRAAGHDVTILDPLQLNDPTPLGGSLALAVSYRVYQWLRQRSFDVIFVTDRSAPAYYSLLARRQGLAFPSTRFVLLLQGPTLWRLEHDGAFLDHLDLLECDALERRCVELADGVQLINPALAGWMEEHSWPRPRTVLADGTVPLSIPVPTRLSRLPLVSVCLVHHDRPACLKQALASLEAQEYPHFEIVLVDDGSSTREAHQLLARLEPLFLARGWPLVRQDNRYLGAARNTAARHARGEYLLFMDDDNLAKPEEIGTLVRVAERTGGDIVTSFMDFFRGERPGLTPECRWLFAGLDSLVGIARNCYGDANALVRREVFDSLGGFTEDHGVTHEDWEFFAKATLHGYRLEVVPQALFWYRVSPGSMIRSTSPARNYARSLRPFLEEVPAAHRDLLRLTQGLALDNLRLRDMLGQGRKPLRYRMADALHAVWRPLSILRYVSSRLNRLRRFGS